MSNMTPRNTLWLRVTTRPARCLHVISRVDDDKAVSLRRQVDLNNLLYFILPRVSRLKLHHFPFQTAA
jgi:hypothetical protein